MVVVHDWMKCGHVYHILSFLLSSLGRYSFLASVMVLEFYNLGKPEFSSVDKLVEVLVVWIVYEVLQHVG